MTTETTKTTKLAHPLTGRVIEVPADKAADWRALGWKNAPKTDAQAGAADTKEATK